MKFIKIIKVNKKTTANNGNCCTTTFIFKTIQINIKF